jgi:hypothetical protein
MHFVNEEIFQNSRLSAAIVVRMMDFYIQIAQIAGIFLFVASRIFAKSKDNLIDSQI